MVYLFLGISFIFLSYVFFKNKFIKKSICFKHKDQETGRGILHKLGFGVYDTYHPIIIIENLYFTLQEESDDDNGNDSTTSSQSSSQSNESPESEDIMEKEAKELSSRHIDHSGEETETNETVIPF